MTDKSPNLLERFRKEMEELYPIEGIVSKFQFERQINGKAFG